MSQTPACLPVEQALAFVGRWRRAPDQPIACPLCAKGVLVVSDHSARPHAEWYRLRCEDCGLDQSLHIPLSSPIITPD